MEISTERVTVGSLSFNPQAVMLLILGIPFIIMFLKLVWWR